MTNKQTTQAKQALEIISTDVNDACWAFVEAMPHKIPGAIFNDLKPAIYAAICKYLEQAVMAKRVPMTVDQQLEAAKSMRLETKHDPHIVSFLMGVEAAERHHGIISGKAGA